MAGRNNNIPAQPQARLGVTTDNSQGSFFNRSLEGITDSATQAILSDISRAETAARNAETAATGASMSAATALTEATAAAAARDLAHCWATGRTNVSRSIMRHPRDDQGRLLGRWQGTVTTPQSITLTGTPTGLAWNNPDETALLAATYTVVTGADIPTFSGFGANTTNTPHPDLPVFRAQNVTISGTTNDYYIWWKNTPIDVDAYVADATPSNDPVNVREWIGQGWVISTANANTSNNGFRHETGVDISGNSGDVQANADILRRINAAAPTPPTVDQIDGTYMAGQFADISRFRDGTIDFNVTSTSMTGEVTGTINRYLAEVDAADRPPQGTNGFISLPEETITLDPSGVCDDENNSFYWAVQAAELAAQADDIELQIELAQGRVAAINLGSDVDQALVEYARSWVDGSQPGMVGVAPNQRPAGEVLRDAGIDLPAGGPNDNAIYHATQARMSATAAAGSASQTMRDAASTAEDRRQSDSARLQAQTQASIAGNNAVLAQSWAEGGTGDRMGEDTDNAMYYSGQAGTSATAADASATQS